MVHSETSRLWRGAGTGYPRVPTAQASDLLRGLHSLLRPLPWGDHTCSITGRSRGLHLPFRERWLGDVKVHVQENPSDASRFSRKVAKATRLLEVSVISVAKPTFQTVPAFLKIV